MKIVFDMCSNWGTTNSFTCCVLHNIVSGYRGPGSGQTELQWNPEFFEPPKEMKIGLLTNQVVWEIGDKITVFNWGEKNGFWFKLLEGWKKRRVQEIRRCYVSYLLLYLFSWSVKTIPGILSFDFKNLWKEAGGNGSSSSGSLIPTLYLFPASLRIASISLTWKT